MLPVWLLIAAVLILPVVLRWAEGDEPGNGIEYHSVNEPRDEEDPDLTAAA